MLQLKMYFNAFSSQKHYRQTFFVFLPFVKNRIPMSLLRVLLAIFFPPLAVIDRGCGSVLIVLILTLCGWVPGVIGALVILNKN